MTWRAIHARPYLKDKYGNVINELDPADDIQIIVVSGTTGEQTFVTVVPNADGTGLVAPHQVTVASDSLQVTATIAGSTVVPVGPSEVTTGTKIEAQSISAAASIAASDMPAEGEVVNHIAGQYFVYYILAMDANGNRAYDDVFLTVVLLVGPARCRSP